MLINLFLYCELGINCFVNFYKRNIEETLFLLKTHNRRDREERKKLIAMAKKNRITTSNLQGAQPQENRLITTNMQGVQPQVYQSSHVQYTVHDADR